MNSIDILLSVARDALKFAKMDVDTRRKIVKAINDVETAKELRVANTFSTRRLSDQVNNMDMVDILITIIGEN